MSIKEYIRKNYAYLLSNKPAVIMVAGDCFMCDSLTGIVDKPEFQDLLDHQFVLLSRGFDNRNRESYLVIGRLDV